MTIAAFSLSFRNDTLTTTSKATLERMAKALGFTQNQTVLYALARLRDDLKLGTEEPAAQTANPANSVYADLSAEQLQIIRKNAPVRSTAPIRSRSIIEAL